MKLPSQQIAENPISGKGTFCKKSSSLTAKELSLRAEDALSSPRIITLSWETTALPWKSNFQKESLADLFQLLFRQFPNRQPVVCFQRLYPSYFTAFEKFSTLLRSFLHFWEVLSQSDISLRNSVPWSRIRDVSLKGGLGQTSQIPMRNFMITHTHTESLSLYADMLHEVVCAQEKKRNKKKFPESYSMHTQTLFLFLSNSLCCLYQKVHHLADLNRLNTSSMSESTWTIATIC